MQLKRIKIQNYRLLVNAVMEVDSKTTLIVGRNNTAKTSFFKCITSVLNGESFTFNDYPLGKRKNIYNNIVAYTKNTLTFVDLCKKIEPISIEFLVDYTSDGPEDNLGALSPFIIDVDENTTTALILIEYKLKKDEKSFRGVLENCFYKDGSDVLDNDAYKAISENFNRLFEITIYAVNPNNRDEKQIKNYSELKALFPFQLIPAERLLGEDGSQNSSLSKLISDYFEMSEDIIDPSITEKVMELRAIVSDANKNVQKNSDEILSALVKNAVGFGYPNGEELELGVTTQLSIDDQIKNRTTLSYTAGSNEESLPSEYNGLGYKNLIKIEFLLAAFARSVDECGDTCISLLFIEEPESHMHPQLQQAFADYLEGFLKKITSTRVQTFLSSHSAHIANTMDFSKIRYAQKTREGVVYKNLNEFSQQNPSNIDFIRKYLTLTKCDLFFADKAIFVEGASERLLLPDMIEKCNAKGDFDSQKYKLPHQYFTIIEIGGAYAFKFIPFAEFLDIPCLIFTDLDPVAEEIGADGRTHYHAALVSQGKTTSNETLKSWVRRCNSLSEENRISLDDITAMSSDKKTIGKCHIEFQVKERGLCGRSLEEAIINANRSLYGLDDGVTEDDLIFKDKSKTDFALNLIYDKEDYSVPQYIRNGLIWLNEEKVLK